MKESKRTLGERLQAVIELRGYSQRQLELKTRLVGHRVPQSHISRIIRDDQIPGYDVLLALAQALDVSLDWLATGETRQPDELTPEQAELIRLYNAIQSPTLRNMALDLVRAQVEADKEIRGEK